MKTTFLLLGLTSTLILAQGDLNPPPGGPTATMKTLDQLEARAPIPPSPATPTAGPDFFIFKPGSYYLTGNITVASGNGIVVNSDDVSIDLNGFTIKSNQTNGASGNAINVISDRSRITIKNGSIVSGTVLVNGVVTTVAGFLNGIHSDTSITQAHISDVHVSGTAGIGIKINEGGVIERCTVSSCGGTGISTTDGSISHSTSNNNGLHGFDTPKTSITHCTANKNQYYGIYAVAGTVAHCITNNNTDGIDADGGSVSYSTANNNRFTGIFAELGTVTCSTATSNGHSGIYASGGSVTHCRASANLHNGIDVQKGVAAYCVASANGSSPSISYKQILTAAFPNGQRVNCIPTSE